ncbi:arginine N-succinyltransferase [Niveibacterium sp. 24ML]|uniref:arginine N-succinyltransferase n=1 Tax=Niveibacterium sp. 24ML TaxID=2985512 RepID=UPI00226D8D09|nr:arginine N-succinyltransferase [Niveibacterium sp. 24ML]MCX9157699.1 arginine N-succinyltransferase [Niveibacterium sp. 24ML]
MTQLRIRSAVAEDLPAIAALMADCGRQQAGVQWPPAAGEHLLVADTGEGGAVLGCLRLSAAIGLRQPRYWYHVGCVVHAARELDLFQRQRTLLLGNNHTGASELADIAWARSGVPLAEQALVLNLLVQTAMLLMARRREAFASHLVVELPGLRDVAGQAPFWQGLGRQFCRRDPLLAREQFGDDWRAHAAALLPRQTVYASFLPAAAQEAIAQASPAARVLQEVLEAAGLRYSHHISIDDGGPVLEADVDTLGAVMASRVWSISLRDAATASVPMLVAQGDAGNWRAVLVQAAVANGKLALAQEDMARLGAGEGAQVWAAPLRSEFGPLSGCVAARA